MTHFILSFGEILELSFRFHQSYVKNRIQFIVNRSPSQNTDGFMVADLSGKKNGFMVADLSGKKIRSED